MMKTIASASGEPEQHVEMTDAEVAEFSAAQSAVQVAQAKSDLKASIQAALDRSDMTALRCFKAGVSFPDEWKTYVTALRNGTLPTQPAYPKGT